GEKYRQQMNYVQWAVLVVVSLILIQDALASNTVYDALIIGSLALASLIGGMIYQQKSFFFVGAGVLLLNVFLQTRPFWGALPWWAYLLIAGALLITVASYNERSEEHTSELQSRFEFVCRLLLEKNTSCQPRCLRPPARRPTPTWRAQQPPRPRRRTSRAGDNATAASRTSGAAAGRCPLRGQRFV